MYENDVYLCYVKPDKQQIGGKIVWILQANSDNDKVRQGSFTWSPCGKTCGKCE